MASDRSRTRISKTEILSDRWRKGIKETEIPSDRWQVTYLYTELKEGGLFFKGTLAGLGGKAMFNNREWSGGECTNGICLPQYPFDPKNTETWLVILRPSDSSMVLVRGGNPYNIPLDCDGNLMVGTYAEVGLLKIVWSTTKYVLSLNRHQKESF